MKKYKELTNHELFSMIRRGYAFLTWWRPKTPAEYKKDTRYQKLEAGYKLLTNEAWNRGMPEISLRNYDCQNLKVEDMTNEELAIIFGVYPSCK